ncbi:MAG: hypothetical protein M3322_04335, partial [Actinomycetota bacterium]|nr:hypothetical protein [Actinomycetota bacterium]
AWLAGRSVAIDQRELHGARRRALLLLAAGGDPVDGLVPDSRAVSSLADELGDERRRRQLAGGLAELRAGTGGLPRVEVAVDRLLSDGERAWRAFSCALLAEELGDDGSATTAP